MGPLSVLLATYATDIADARQRGLIKEAKLVMTTSTYPVKVNALLDTRLSRGLWLVKWLLAIMSTEENAARYVPRRREA